MSTHPQDSWLMTRNKLKLEMLRKFCTALYWLHQVSVYKLVAVIIHVHVVPTLKVYVYDMYYKKLQASISTVWCIVGNNTEL